MSRHLPILESRSAIPETLPQRPQGFAFPRALTDDRGRRYEYLRLSVTDRCDLACLYCMPPSGEDEHALRRDLLTFEEAARLIRVAGAMGMRRVRLTGGEPLVRKDIVRLVALVHRRSDVEEIVMTTNATRLAELAHPLREAGLHGVNISIDTLDEAKFRDLTRGGDLRTVQAGIRAALDARLVVKFNTVVMRGINDEDVAELVDYAWSLGATPRFIELMPIGEAAALLPARFVPAEEIVGRLGSRLADEAERSVSGHGPARYRVAADRSRRRVGFITAVSKDFCSECNRVRVTARGDLRPCLAARRAVSVRDIMRDGGDDLDIAWALTWALRSKDAGHHFTEPEVREHEQLGMSLIGG